MLSSTWVLMRTRFIITRNTFWRGSIRRKIGLLVVLSLIGLASLGIYNFVRFIVASLRSPRFAEILREASTQVAGLPTDVGPYLEAVPNVALFAALLLLVFSSFSGLLSSLYLSGDMDMLLVAPVPMRSVFVAKFFGGLLPQYTLIAALLGPLLIGYGQGMGFGPLYFVCAVLVLALLPLLPAGLGALLVMAVVRVVPARRAREIVSIIGGMIGLVFYVISQFSREVGQQVANPSSLQALLLSDFPLLPSAWAGRALVAAGNLQPLPLLLFGGTFLAASLLIFTSCVVLAERLYYAGWSNMSTQGGRVRQKEKAKRQDGADQRPPFYLVPLTTLIPDQSRSIVAKDLRLFVRDLRNLQQLIFPLALAAIWTFRMLTTPRDPGLTEGAPEWVLQLNSFGGAGIAFFICLSLSGGLAGSGVSREGKAYWILKLAPISALRLLLGKFLLAYLPYPTVGTLFLALLAFLAHTSPLVVLQQWLLLLLAGLGSAAIGIGLGAAFPRLNWENPQQQTTWQTSCLGSLLYPLYLLLTLGLVLGASALGPLVGGGAAGVSVQMVGWALAIIVTGAACWLALLVGSRGLDRVEI